MALRFRLARHGAKKHPFYWVVVANKDAPRDGAFLEKLGTYDPQLAKDKFSVNVDRVKHWLSHGVLPTDRVRKIFETLGVLPVRPVKETPKKSAPKKKAQERAKQLEALRAETAKKEAAAAPA